MDKLFQKGAFMDIQTATEILFELKRISNTLKENGTEVLFELNKISNSLKEIEKKLNEKSEKINDN